jgi:hypothetical protein
MGGIIAQYSIYTVTINHQSFLIDIAIMSFKTNLFINGKFVEPVKGGKFPTYNPATGKIIQKLLFFEVQFIDDLS